MDERVNRARRRPADLPRSIGGQPETVGQSYIRILLRGIARLRHSAHIGPSPGGGKTQAPPTANGYAEATERRGCNSGVWSTVDSADARTDRQDITDDDAIYGEVLHFYAVERRLLHNEQTTALAADRIVAVARSLGICPQRTPFELGFEHDFTWALEARRPCIGRLRTAQTRLRVRQLHDAIRHLSVAELEAHPTGRGR